MQIHICRISKMTLLPPPHRSERAGEFVVTVKPATDDLSFFKIDFNAKKVGQSINGLTDLFGVQGGNHFALTGF